MKFMSEQRQRGNRRGATLTRARTTFHRLATSRGRRRVTGAQAEQAWALSPQGPCQAAASARRVALRRSVTARRCGMDRVSRRARRGVATLDYALLIGIVLPLAAFVLVIAPQIMLRVYEMVCTMVSWPFM